MALGCGDGAVVQTSHSHPSTSALNKFAQLLDLPNEFCAWDPFHVYDNLGSRALHTNERVVDFLELTKTCDVAFGSGQGPLFACCNVFWQFCSQLTSCTRALGCSKWGGGSRYHSLSFNVSPQDTLSTTQCLSIWSSPI